MKVAIILFSPSGNTNRAGELLKAQLENNSIATQLINIAGDQDYFLSSDKRSYLENIVLSHNVLMIGSPVYAHHLQYHVQELIQSLPRPDQKWGNIAMPFITYGGISSGIALEEASKLLRKSGRIVTAGMKISSSHHMTKAFFKEEFNNNQPIETIMQTIDALVRRITVYPAQLSQKHSAKLKYQSRKKYLVANIVFKEKEWHDKKYPKIFVEKNLCTKCGRCSLVCPVCHLTQDFNNDVVENADSPCIHCFNCVFSCPQRAIHPIGNPEKPRAFMEKNIRNANETPSTCLYPKN